MTIILLAACGNQPSTPPQPQSHPGVAITLAWRGSGDLDIHVGGKSAYTMGGSPDQTLGGGTEAYTFSSSSNAAPEDSVVVGVINRSAQPGGSGDSGMTATFTISDVNGATSTAEHAMKTEQWDAFIVFPASGTFVINRENETGPIAPRSPR